MPVNVDILPHKITQTHLINQRILNTTSKNIHSSDYNSKRLISYKSATLFTV